MKNTNNPMSIMAIVFIFLLVFTLLFSPKHDVISVASNNLENTTKVLQNTNVKELKDSKDSKDLARLESDLAHSKLEIQFLESKINQAKSNNQ